MNNRLINSGKGIACVVGFVLFAHSNFMSVTLKQKINPHPIFLHNDEYFREYFIKSDEDDVLPLKNCTAIPPLYPGK